MLEVKHLVKVYKSKGGVNTKALDDVSLTFPETGMVFLLGKSGSGKSTLLNVIGGLDIPDSGEIIIKGKNSKTFSGADFDSYRNTYIGFIFQEYNILEEFNIEQNISLALQLQGKPNDKKAVEEILQQVDLSGFGKRKPNTLSGGQKQRVAIARALIKNPEIIMADEPTGALDSNTGKQVFDTLKKLSLEKLIIIVSHDRDFAEHYADRIIELSDGKIISDVSKQYVTPQELNENINIVNKNTLSIKDTSKLTSKDMEEILKILKGQNGEALISTSDKDIPIIKQTIHVSNDGSSEIFNQTDEVDVKEYDSKQTKFIRSHLPFSRAFKMGTSSLKEKPVRLIFTSLLTIVSLVMFGLTSTLMLFKESYAVSEGLKNSEYVSEAVKKEYKYTRTYQTKDSYTDEVKSSNSYENHSPTFFSASEVNNYNQKGLNFAGVITFRLPYTYSNTYFTFTYPTTTNNSNYYNAYKSISGFIDAGSDYLNNNGFHFVAGDYPNNVDEIALPCYLAQGILESAGRQTNQYDSLIDTDLNVNFSTYGYPSNANFKISGVIDVGELDNKYNDLKKTDGSLNAQQINALQTDFKEILVNSYHTMGYVHPDFFNEYNSMMESSNKIYSNNTRYVSNLSIDLYSHDMSENYNVGNSYYFYKNIKNDSSFKFYNMDAEEISISSFDEKDILLPYRYYEDGYNNEYYDNYLVKINEMLYNRRYIAGLYALNNEEINRYENAINNIWQQRYAKYSSIEEDKMILQELIDDYFVDYLKVNYVIRAADLYLDLINCGMYDSNYNTISNAYNDVYYDTPFQQEKINYLNNLLMDNPLADVSIIFNTLLSIRNSSSEMKNYIAKYNSHETITSEDVDNLKTLLIEAGYKENDLKYNNNYQPTKDFEYQYRDVWYYSSKNGNGKLNVKGFFKSNNQYETFVISDSLAKNYGTLNAYYTEEIIQSDYLFPSDAKYSYIISKSNFSEEQINFMLHDYGTYRLLMTDQVYTDMMLTLNLINTLKTVFMWIGIVTGVFAALMLLNFISTSIASKTREIGILRAVGARGSDLFKIFFSESGVISLICVIMAVAISFFVANMLNNSISQDMGFALLDFNIINIGIMLLGSIIIAFLGTFLPVLLASKKPPVESIRTL